MSTLAPIDHAMLMFAGLGTRLRPFTNVEPKPLLPILGVPAAQLAVDSLAAVGVSTIVANIHHLPQRSRLGLATLELGGGGRRLEISDETVELLGSAGGLRHAKRFLGSGAFYYLNSDVVCDVDLAALARAHTRLRRDRGAKITLAVQPSSPVGAGYREIQLVGVDSRTAMVSGLGAKTAGKPFFTGAAIIESEVLNTLPSTGPCEFVPYILEPAIREGKAGVYLSEGVWKDLGSPSLWLEAHLAMIEALESGRIQAAWRRRFESMNRRIGDRIWVSRRAPLRIDSSRWVGPCYWAPQSTQDIPPRELGPGAVLYGRAPSEEPLSRGIGFSSAWVDA